MTTPKTPPNSGKKTRPIEMPSDDAPDEVTPAEEPQDSAPTKEPAAGEVPPRVEEPATPQVIVIEREAEPDEQPPQGVEPGWGGLFAIMCLAMLASWLLVKLGRIQLLKQVKRWLPLSHLAVWTLALLLSANIVLTTFPLPWQLFMALSLTLLGAAGMSGMRSALAGVALAMEDKLREGDTVQVGGLQGEVMSFGLRAVRLRASDGMTHDIPNERFMSESISTLGGAGGEAACEVQIVMPQGLPIDVALAIAKEGAMLSPLSSPRHRPEAFLESGRRGEQLVIRIRGYAFDPDYREHFRSDVLRRVGASVAQYQQFMPSPNAVMTESKPTSIPTASTILNPS
jgi:hypothetical protein